MEICCIRLISVLKKKNFRFGEEDNPDPVFHPCKGLFNTCCSLKSDKPIIPKIEKKEGCGHRNYEGKTRHCNYCVIYFLDNFNEVAIRSLGIEIFAVQLFKK